MQLLTKAHQDRLLENGIADRIALQRGEDTDFAPIVKLFTPRGPGIWLLSELCPDDPDVAYGLWDLGIGFSRLGSFRISTLARRDYPLALPVERDVHFTATKTLLAYALEAHARGRIVA